MNFKQVMVPSTRFWLLVSVSIFTTAMSACTGVTNDSRGKISVVTIELLGFESCPNTPALGRLIRDAIKELPMGAEFAYIDQEQLAPDDIRRGYPSPTVLVNNTELYGEPEPEQPALGCRAFPDGLPSVQTLAASIAKRISATAGPN